ncbi:MULTISPECIES: type II toxin-antitoxin system RelE/ParE family toxin [Phyllobacterium]|uniref:Addiction module antitoxin RelB n=1 Tax=Phyllobacterium sophorae TaxID=1520277 RepID=A0A2P7BAP7_9HYPH|nr:MULTISPECIES: type II toxin-antitoxin system RelE/ParE family toxin [Phyllobacterium]PSH63557.1 addiction module antitoxin RelB [Phyllobacterium sophorae]UXN63639.1 type II toxin-antitoxin system RelE/ParE family toxin [Phyllobacterium sp. A18/5-2]
MNYSIEKTDTFLNWIEGLQDLRARARIMSRLDRLADGNFGDYKLLGEDVGEMRIDCGPGYRLYFTKQGGILIILLCGGDKSTQSRDIRKAKAMARDLKEIRS